MFWDNYEKLCRSKGETPTEVAFKCGVTSSGTASAWKKGTMPRSAILKSIADYFGVTVADLTADGAGQKNQPTSINGGELAELIRLYTDAEPTLRAAAMAVLKSAESAPNTQDA